MEVEGVKEPYQDLHVRQAIRYTVVMVSLHCLLQSSIVISHSHLAHEPVKREGHHLFPLLQKTPHNTSIDLAWAPALETCPATSPSCRPSEVYWKSQYQTPGSQASVIV